MKQKILSLALALCLALTVPAFAADVPHDVDIMSQKVTWAEWGDPLPADSKLTINGVIGQEAYEGTILFDVVVGGGYTLDMHYPAEKHRFYTTYLDIVLLNGEYVEELDPSCLPAVTNAYGDTEKPLQQYVFTCTEKMMSKPGTELIFHFWLDWDEAELNAVYSSLGGNIEFYLRVNAAPSATGFVDVKDKDYFAEPVRWAVENGVTKGTGKTTFSPSQTCTQGQILTFLWRAKGEPAPKGAANGTAYYAKAAQWAKEQGLIDGTFSADAPCTRLMVVTYLWKLAGSPKTGSANFTDVPASISQAVSWAVEKGVTKGTGGGQFSPDKTCTRGEIVTFLYRALAG